MLLHDLFGEVIVPPAVIAELEHPRSKLPPLLIRGLPYVRIESPRDQALVNDLLDTLDPGESEAIALALNVRADLILVDDATAREVASHRGLIALAVLGTLLCQAEGIPRHVDAADRSVTGRAGILCFFKCPGSSTVRMPENDRP